MLFQFVSRREFVLEALEPRRLLSSVGAFENHADIGAPALPGNASFNNGTYTITAAGADIGGNFDQFHFAYQNTAGDGSITARIGSIANTNSDAKAGLMFRK